MFVILNSDKLFYSKDGDKIFFGNDFAKAALFDTAEIAEEEWEKEGMPAYSVSIESI